MIQARTKPGGVSMGRIDVLIVDDQAIVREGVKRILAEAPDVQIAGEAASGAEAIGLMRNASWDVILLDMSRPDTDGIGILRTIQDYDPRSPVLVLGLYAEDRVALRMLKAGARGYVEKQDAPGELVPAIHRVAEGGHYIGSALADRLSRDLAAARPPWSR